MCFAYRLGSTSDSMSLQLRDTTDAVIAEMGDDAALLGHYGPQEYYTIHVIDDNSSMFADFEDVSKVEKYKISEEEFAKKDGTFRKFKKEMLKKNPNFLTKNKQKIGEDFEEEEAKLIEVGARCEVTVGERRGEVKFVGKVPELANGFWVGIQLDEPTGDSDGSVGHTEYFECGLKYGLFSRPTDLKVGDYPVVDLFDEENDEI
jgi:tubulin-folding cofactor B